MAPVTDNVTYRHTALLQTLSFSHSPSLLSPSPIPPPDSRKEFRFAVDPTLTLANVLLKIREQTGLKQNVPFNLKWLDVEGECSELPVISDCEIKRVCVCVHVRTSLCITTTAEETSSTEPWPCIFYDLSASNIPYLSLCIVSLCTSTALPIELNLLYNFSLFHWFLIVHRDQYYDPTYPGTMATDHITWLVDYVRECTHLIPLTSTSWLSWRKSLEVYITPVFKPLITCTSV